MRRVHHTAAVRRASTARIHPVNGPATPRCPVCNGTRAIPERSLAGHALWRCTGCEMVYVWPRPDRDASRANYAAGHRGQDAAPCNGEIDLFSFYEAEYTPYVREAVRQRLLRLHRMRPVRRLVDFGCGSGHFLGLARDFLGCETFGIELHPVGRLGAERFGFVLHPGPLESCPFPLGSFDLVTCVQVLEHLPDPGAEVSRLATLLAPGGLLFVEVPHYGSLSIRVRRDSFVSNLPPGHLNYFTRRPLVRLLHDRGLVAERVRTTGSPHHALIGHGAVSSESSAGPAEPPTPARDSHAHLPPWQMRARLLLLRSLDEALSLPGWGKHLEVVARRS
jgi:SAM-dependent methyltransferase